jgi:hypothetical protein
MWVVIDEKAGQVGGLFDERSTAEHAVKLNGTERWSVLECTPRAFFAFQQFGGTIAWKVTPDGVLDLEVNE